MKKREIYTSYSPNTRKKDLWLNLRILVQPHTWLRGKHSLKIEEWFKEKYSAKYAFTFNYARSAMYEFFNSVGIKTGDEVIMQAFTCVAAVNPVLWTGAKVIYADIDRTTLTSSLENFKEAYSKNTRAIVIQHTFGIGGKTEEIVKWAHENGLVVLEDCTQVINPITAPQKVLGTLGDAAVFSFGRDKVVSGVDGGLLILNDSALVPNIGSRYAELKSPPFSWIFREILYPLLWAMIKFLWAEVTLGMKSGKTGKSLHFLFTKLGLLTRATDADEKIGLRPEYIPSRLPNALAQLAYNQLQDIEELNNHRIMITQIYQTGLNEISEIRKLAIPAGAVLLRYPILVNNADKLIKYCQSYGVVLGDWYRTPVAPAEVDISSTGYHREDAPTAEEVCKQIVNLPTNINITIEDAEYIVKLLSEFYLKEV